MTERLSLFDEENNPSGSLHRSLLEITEKQEIKIPSIIRTETHQINIPEDKMQIVQQLMEMGFTLFEAVIIVHQSQPETINQVFAYMDNNPGIIAHPFKQQVDSNSLCEICLEDRTAHAFFVEDDKIFETIETKRQSLKSIGKDEEPLGKPNDDDLNQSSEDIERLIRSNIDAEPIEYLSQRIATLQIRETMTLQECKVCFEDVKANTIIKFDGETHDICQPCFKTFLEQSINEGKVLDLCCPHCAKRLTYAFIQQILDPVSFGKFRKYLLSQLVTIDPLMRWCPNPKCGVSVTLPKNFKRKAQCTTCQTYLCTECNREYHKNSCNDFFKKEIKQWENHADVQRCSYCKTVIAKNAGCNHMTCTVCRNEWCWICGGSYTSLHFKSLNPFGCPSLQFSDNNSPFKIFFFRLLLIIGWILAIPIAFVIGLPIYAIMLRANRDFPYQINESWFLFILCFILSIILQPIADALVLVAAIPALIGLGIWYLIQIRRKRKQQKSFLSQNRVLLGLGISRAQLQN